MASNLIFFRCFCVCFRFQTILVLNSRSVEESIRDNSSDSTSTSESPKPGDTHLVSRSSQTIVTMSQIQDNPIMPDTKIIVNDAPAPDIVSEQEDNKDRVFADADGEDSEEVSSMDSEGEQAFPHHHQNCHGRECVGDRCNGSGGGSKAPGARGGPAHGASSSRGNDDSENLGSTNFPFLDSDRPFRCDICGECLAYILLAHPLRVFFCRLWRSSCFCHYNKSIILTVC